MSPIMEKLHRDYKHLNNSWGMKFHKNRKGFVLDCRKMAVLEGYIGPQPRDLEAMFGKSLDSKEK